MDCDFQNLFTNKLIKMITQYSVIEKIINALNCALVKSAGLILIVRFILFDDGKAPLARKDTQGEGTSFTKRPILNATGT